MHDLLKHRDKRTQIDLAILDFPKAFDTVPRQRMLGKLSFYGIKGTLLNWPCGLSAASILCTSVLHGPEI